MKSKLKTYNEFGETVKIRKVDWWKIVTDKGNEGICINLNSPDENPTKEGHGREIFIKFEDIEKEKNRI